jgi:drug/metabolite transporter (DMT)-like permease
VAQQAMPYGEILATTTALCWSIAVIQFRKAGYRIKDLPLAVYKTIVGTVFLILAVVVCRMFFAEETGVTQWWLTLTNDQWFRLTLSGFLGVAVGDLLFIAGLNRLGAGLTAIVDCAYSPLVILFAFLLYSEIVPPPVFFGGGLVLLAIIVGAEVDESQSLGVRQLVIGTILAITSLASMVYGVLIIKDVFKTQPVMWVVAYRFSIGSLALFLWALLTGKIKETVAIFSMPERRPANIGSFFGTFLASFFWIMGFKYTLSGKAAILNQLSTPFIFILGAWLLKEKLTPRRVIAIVLAFIGAIIVGLS